MDAQVGRVAPATIAGPTGQNVSKPLPRNHWPSLNWRSRGADVVRAGVAGDDLERVRGRDP